MDYTALANAIKTTLEADSWLGNVANVVTIEAFPREFSLQGEGGQLFYEESELPAMSINPNADPKGQDTETVGEILESVSAEITTISYHTDPSTAYTEHNTILSNLERVLDAQKTSVADLGIDALVKDVSTTPGTFKKGSNYFYYSRTNFTVLLTTLY